MRAMTLLANVVLLVVSAPDLIAQTPLPAPIVSLLPPVPNPIPVPIPAAESQRYSVPLPAASTAAPATPASSTLTTPYSVTTANSSGSQSPSQMPKPEVSPSLKAVPSQNLPQDQNQQFYGDQPLLEVVEVRPYEPRWRSDLLLGAPSGIRVQHQLGQSQFWAEIGGGSYLWWPAVFAGIRSEGRLFSGRSDVFSVRPGIDAYFLQGYSYNDYGWRDNWDYSHRVHSAGMASLDFDLSWKHRWLNSLHSEVALKLGAGVAFNSRDVYVLPLAGVALGLNY